MSKQIDGYGDQVAGTVLSVFKNDKHGLKNNINQLVYSAAKHCSDVKELQLMGPHVMNMVWEVAEPSTKSANPDDHFDTLVNPTTECISGMID